MNSIDSIAKGRCLTRFSAFNCLIILIMAFAGCNAQKIEIRGTVVTYDYVKLDGIHLTYFVMNKSDDKDLPRGTARIRSDGQFRIRIKRQEQLPFWVVIDGVDVVPEVSVENNSYEVSDYRETKIDLGDVYVYDYIRILDDLRHSVVLKDFTVRWESNIPDVDYFTVEFLQKIRIAGIKGNSFSFDTITPLLRKPGTYKVGDIEVLNRNGRIEGVCFLAVRAVRLIDGHPVTVGSSVLRDVSIIGK